MKILLIEDNPAEALIFTNTLENLLDGELDIRHTDTLDQAVDILGKDGHDLDLVFLDLKLADCGDWEQTYSAIAPFSTKVPVIVMSGDDDMDKAREVLRRGAEDFIVKGGHKRRPEILRETIDFALCRHKATKQIADDRDLDEQCIHWLSGGYSVK